MYTYCSSIAVIRTSVRVSREVYKAMRELVEAGIYPSMSDIVREAIIRLLKEQGIRLRAER